MTLTAPLAPRPQPRHGHTFLATYTARDSRGDVHSGFLRYRYNGFEFTSPPAQAWHEIGVLCRANGLTLSGVTLRPDGRLLPVPAAAVVDHVVLPIPVLGTKQNVHIGITLSRN